MRTRRGDGDLGESLIELLLTIAILGTAFAAILGGIGTAVLVSGINGDQAHDASAVRAIAERLQREPFTACATAVDYESAVAADLPGAAFDLAVRYSTGGEFSTGCVGPTVVLQEIAITTYTADTRAQVTQPLVVLKRKP
jgi:hypothetical protein